MSDWGYACCPRCLHRPPLIATFAWHKFEFYCLDCGGKFGFLQPLSKKGNEVAESHARLQAEWDEHVEDGLITQGREDRATPEALAAHEAALQWLRDRVRAVAQ